MMDKIDEHAATFRFPVTNQGEVWDRRPFADMAMLSETGTSFETDLLRLLRVTENACPLRSPATETGAPARFAVPATSVDHPLLCSVLSGFFTSCLPRLRVPRRPRRSCVPTCAPRSAPAPREV